MSTEQRLNPTIRRSRSERRALERFFAARTQHTIARIASAATAAAIVLAQLRLDSVRWGEKKHAIAVRVCGEYIANVRRALLEIGIPEPMIEAMLAEHPDVPHGILTVH